MELLYRSHEEVDLSRLDAAAQQQERCFRLVSPCNGLVARVEVPTGLAVHSPSSKTGDLTLSWRLSEALVPGRIRAECTVKISKPRWYSFEFSREIPVNLGAVYWIGVRSNLGPIGPQWQVHLSNEGNPIVVDPDNWILLPSTPEMQPKTEVFLFRDGRWQRPIQSGLAVRIYGRKTTR